MYDKSLRGRLENYLEKHEAEWTREIQTRKGEFLAVVKAHEAIF